MFYFFVRTTIFVAEELLYTPFIHYFQFFLAILPAAALFWVRCGCRFPNCVRGRSWPRPDQRACHSTTFAILSIKYQILDIRYQISNMMYEYLIWVGAGLGWIREVAICTCDPKISMQSLIMQLLLEKAGFFAIGCGVACCC